MPTDLVDQIFRRVNALPPLPAAVQRLNQMTKDIEVNYDEMAEVIATDEVLTTKILRVANSSFYGLSQRVGTVSQAIVVLGLQGVRSLAVGVTLFGFKAGVADACPLKRVTLWRHSLGVASAARSLAAQFSIHNWEESFVGGMLHDIGKIIFMECFPKEYTTVLEGAVSGTKSLELLEKETFGIDHSALGAELCRRWRMPANLSHMVAMHHLIPRQKEISSEQDRMLFAVRIADNLARIAQIGSDGNPNVASDFLELVRGMELSPEQLRQYILQLPEEVRKVEVFFDLLPEVGPPVVPTAPSVGILLENRDDAELIRITLLALGYPLVTSGEIAENKVPLSGVIVDDALPRETHSRLEKRGIRLLNFEQWRTENALTDETVHLNVNRLRTWLTQQLQPPEASQP
jgi:putative nucleotidyltransferase with HDIG domain